MCLGGLWILVQTYFLRLLRVDTRTFIHILALLSTLGLLIDYSLPYTSSISIVLGPISHYLSYIAYCLLLLMFSSVLSQSGGARSDKRVRGLILLITCLGVLYPILRILLATISGNSIHVFSEAVQLTMPLLWLLITSIFTLYGYRFYHRAFHRGQCSLTTRAVLCRLTKMCLVGSITFAITSILDILWITIPQALYRPSLHLTLIPLLNLTQAVRSGTLLLLLRASHPSSTSPSRGSLGRTNSQDTEVSGGWKHRFLPSSWSSLRFPWRASHSWSTVHSESRPKSHTASCGEGSSGENGHRVDPSFLSSLGAYGWSKDLSSTRKPWKKSTSAYTLPSSTMGHSPHHSLSSSSLSDHSNCHIGSILLTTATIVVHEEDEEEKVAWGKGHGNQAGKGHRTK